MFDGQDEIAVGGRRCSRDWGGLGFVVRSCSLLSLSVIYTSAGECSSCVCASMMVRCPFFKAKTK